ncbi:hypothetical protein ACLB6G_08885 [Zhengella sp. ZM62]|uniref:hypothetical protein n=1 Tax=Zhengella sedimenti TaxID=3390035 RepID=UPI0039763308
MKTAIYRLRPAAANYDPNWDRAPNQGEVLVRALSPADARIVASEAENDFLESDAKPGDGVSTRFASAFRDEKLYEVLEMADAAHAAEGPRAVLEGRIGNPLKTDPSAGDRPDDD